MQTTHGGQEVIPYGSAEPLTIVWNFKAEVWTDSKGVEAECMVVQSKGPILLGRQTSTQLNLLLLAMFKKKSSTRNWKSNIPSVSRQQENSVIFNCSCTLTSLYDQ